MAMPPDDVPPPTMHAAWPVAHLYLCPYCEDGLVSVARWCSGMRDPDHLDWWFQLVRQSHLYLLSHLVSHVEGRSIVREQAAT